MNETDLAIGDELPYSIPFPVVFVGSRQSSMNHHPQLTTEGSIAIFPSIAGHGECLRSPRACDAGHNVDRGHIGSDFDPATRKSRSLFAR